MKNAKPHYRNNRLFSHAFLEEHLPNLPEWQILEDELERAREKLQDLFQRALPTTSEAALEEELIRPILADVLGFSYLVQPSAAVFKTHRQPDYALFASEEEKQGAKAFDGDKRLFENALAVADAKAWDVDLDAVGPASQMHDYVLISGVRWGILSNGRRWRLTHRDTVHELDTFFEIDLEELLKTDDPTLLKYFLVFFRAESFQPGGFLDHVLTQSAEYAQRVGAELKENVYEALRCLCQGFLGGNAELSHEHLSTIHQNALIVLYRILFLLYAESEPERELLPLSNAEYKEQIGLCAVKRKVSEKSDWLEEKHALWTELRDLFRLINQGSEPLGICAYNGGLFDPQLHPLLERWQIGDLYLAEALRLLACTEVEGRRSFLDYSALDVRELGSIYEGLLEHKLILKDGALEWEKDRSQRKKTGSYYTPEYIVQYIVEQTIGPLIDEIQSGLKNDLDELTEKIRRARGENRTLLEQQRDNLLKKARERVLNQKVLDPAMGSGHFLVSACDYVARRIAELEAELAGEETEEAVQALKRTVAERCLYGVDLNPLATELAKLSLWLHTVAKDKPLSFLDHHLRTGNSLIGARVKDLERPPSGKAHEIGLWESKLVQDLAKAIGYLNFIKASASASRSDIEEKKQRWKLVNAWIGKYKQAANVWLSSHFGSSVSDDVFRQILEAAASGTMDGISDSPVFRQAQKIAAEKRFFHWELEFPDVFFDDHGKRLENPGFDAVVGNPPYDVLVGTRRRPSLEEELACYRNSGLYKFAFGGRLNIYRIFIERGLQCLRTGGNLGFIVPEGFYGDRGAETLRRFVFSTARLFTSEVFPHDSVEHRVFPEAEQAVCIVTGQKGGETKSLTLRIHPSRYIDLSSPVITLTIDQILEIDKESLSIPIVDEPHLKLVIKLHTNPEACLFGGANGIAQGFEGEINVTAHKHFIRDFDTGTMLVRGEHVHRYQAILDDTTTRHRWIDKKEFLSATEGIPKSLHHKKPRVAIQGIKGKNRRRRITACLVPSGVFLANSADYYLVERPYDPLYLLAHLNSQVPEWRFRLTSTNNNINIYEIEAIPIRRIAFVTPKNERARLLDEGKRLYFEALAKLGLEADNQSTNDTPPTKSKSAGGGVG